MLGNLKIQFDKNIIAVKNIVIIKQIYMNNFSYDNESILDTIKNNKKISIALPLVVVAVVILFFFGPKISAPQLDLSTATEAASLIRNNDIKRGKLDSNITVIIFEDPQCPACQSFSKTYSPQLEKFKDRVRFVYKYIQVTSGHTYAKEAVRYIYSAESLNKKGYELAEKIYEKSSNPQALNRAELLGYSNEMGIDANKLTEEISKKEVLTIASQQEKDFEFSYPAVEGLTKENARLNSTPSAVIMKDNKILKITTGQESKNLVDPKRPFATQEIPTFLETLFK